MLCVCVTGYRLYVNSNPKGMVSGTQTRALLEGLQLSTPYRYRTLWPSTMVFYPSIHAYYGRKQKAEKFISS